MDISLLITNMGLPRWW